MTDPTLGQQGEPSSDTPRGTYDAERIRELRERLYTRGADANRVGRRSLPPIPQPSAPEPARPVPAVVPEPKMEPTTPVSYEAEPMSKQKRPYRTWVIIASIVFFVLALVISGALMFFGDNTISGENISISASGPLQVGGGEEFKFRVTLSNQNTVPIQAATLIIEYPRGTQSMTDPPQDLSIERRSLDTIGTGELVNVELSARMYGDENEEREIRTRIEYRIDGSNATFEKRAEPLRFKISTSPVVLSIDSVKTVSSGQEVELDLTVQSNSPTPLSNVLVKMAYPNGFDFTKSEPETVSGEDTWRIANMEPGEKKTITIRGLLTGYEDEVREFNVVAGVSGGTNPNEMGSQLATGKSEITIEKPFLALEVSVNSNSDETVIVGTKEDATVNIVFKNSLDTVIYDGEVSVKLGGNSVSRFNVDVTDGFYNSSQDTITWIGAEESSLREILPGARSSFAFRVSPKDNVGAGAELTLEITAKGKRIFDDRPTETIQGTLARTVRIESIPELKGDVYHATGPFTNSGPVPPVAGTVTQYTLTLSTAAGSNDITGGEVTATLPQYVDWLDLVSDGDTVTYNPTTRVVKWLVGDVEGGETEDVSMQVSFKPSTSQVGRTPTLLDIQRLRATDRFTGTVVRDEHSALTTRISNREDEDEREGQVQPAS